MTASPLEGRRILSYYPLGATDLGGVATSFRGWVDGWSRCGVEVLAVTREGEAPESSPAQWEKLEHRSVGPLSLPVGLAGILRASDVMVLHSGWAAHNIVAARAARRAGIPYVLVPHGAYDPLIVARRAALKSLWLRTLEARHLKHSLAVHVFFDGERDNLARLGYTGQVLVAPNGVELPPASSDGTGSGILWMGRLDPQHKGLDLLIGALERIPEVDLRLFGVGTGEQGAVVRSLIERSSAKERISLEDPVRGGDKWAVLGSAAVFAYPSRWDAHSIAIMEAAACGLPVVTTDRTFIGRDLDARGVAIAAAPEPEALAEALNKALDDEGRAMGRRAAEVVRSEFTWPAVAARFLDQLAALLPEPGRHR